MRDVIDGKQSAVTFTASLWEMIQESDAMIEMEMKEKSELVEELDHCDTLTTP